MIKIKSKKIEGIIGEIIDQYTYADTSERPWIIGFSGGKDSTVLKHIIEGMGYNIPCVFSNTGLEMPEIVKFARAQKNVVE